MTTETLPAGAGLSAVDRESLLEELRAELMDSMPVNRFQTDSQDIDKAGTGTSGFPWHYWKKRDGRVITGPEPRDQPTFGIYQRKGYTHMPQYGRLPTPGSRVPCCPNLAMKEHQYHVLMANGGAKELAVAQVISAGWHLRPPAVHGKTITFPQLKDVEVESIECPECDKPLYGIKGTNQVMLVMRQHGRAVHAFSRRDVDEALWSIGYLSEEMPRPPRRRRSPVTEE